MSASSEREDARRHPANDAVGGRRFELAVATLVALCTVVPVVVAFVFDWQHRADLDAPKGDLALVQIGVHAASRFARSLGPYSQFGFAHPGPAMFYLLAPFYLLTGSRAIGLHLGTAIVAIVSILALHHATWDSASRSPMRALVAGLVFLAGLVGFSQDYQLGAAFTSPWNPVIAAFATLATASAASGARAGRASLLPLVVASHALAAQSHATAAIAATPMLALALFSPAASSASASAIDDRHVKRMRLVSLAVFLVAWAPTLWDVLVHRGGNVEAILRFALSDRRRIGADWLPEAALQALAWPVDGVLRWLGFAARMPTTAVAMWTVGLLVAVFDARSRASRAADGCRSVARLDVGLAGFVGALATVPFLRGHEVSYLAYPIGVTTVFLHVAVVHEIELGSRMRRPLQLVLGLALVGAVVSSSGVVLQTARGGFRRFANEWPAAARIVPVARCAAMQGPLAITLVGDQAWVLGATAALAVLESGHVPLLAESERHRFGEPLAYGDPNDRNSRNRLLVGWDMRFERPGALRLPVGFVALDPAWERSSPAERDRLRGCLDAPRRR